jgi:ribonucleoside-diphosphate reductase alpha chain
MRFEPSGPTGDRDVPNATSPLDYIFRRLALDNLSFDDRSMYGVYTTAERKHAIENGGFYEELTDENEGFGDAPLSRKSEEAEQDFAKIEAEKAEFSRKNSSESVEENFSRPSTDNEIFAKTANEKSRVFDDSFAENVSQKPDASSSSGEHGKISSLQNVNSTAELMEKMGASDDAPICMNCGVKMRPAGSCYICELCGSTSGCS